MLVRLARVAAIACLPIAACQFDPSGLEAAPPSGLVLPDAAPSPDAAARADAAVPAPFCDPADATLVACYRFETAEHAEQPFDESQFGNHGTATKVGTTGGPGVHGEAMVVSKDSSVRVPDSASLDVTGALTLELWINPHQLPESERSGLLDNNGQYGLFLTRDGAIRCAITATVLSGLSIPEDTWTHVACAYDGATVTLYQNGVAGPSSAASPLGTAGTDGLALGQNSPSGDPFEGAIDQVRIWRARRTAAQLCDAAGC